MIERKDKFNWRPGATAPKDGSPFVCLSLITHVGGLQRQCDYELWLTVIARHWFADDMEPPQPRTGDGYWQARGGYSQPDDRVLGGWWTTIGEYGAAVESMPSWRDAPTDWWSTGPVVFVRPTDSRWDFAKDRVALCARVFASSGTHPDHQVPTPWYDCLHPDKRAQPRLLDEGSCGERGYRWCLVADFLPQEAFARWLEQLRHRYTVEVERVERLARGEVRP